MTEEQRTYNQKQSTNIKPNNNGSTLKKHSSLLATSPTTISTYASMVEPKPKLATRKTILLTSKYTLPNSLKDKLVGDVLVACGITLGVTPFLTVVDKAIVQRAAGTHSILQSSFESISSMVRHPATYVKSPMFLMMWGVYAATYTAANTLKTIFEHQEHHSNAKAKDDDKTKSKMAMFVGTTFVNSSTTMLKDRAYATMFGTTGAATKVPLITYGLWGSRDCMVIGSSFVLPDIMSKTLQDNTGLDQKDALRISQFTCPILTQFIAGPVQLLGLDFYNRPMTNFSVTQAAVERMKLLGSNFVSVVGARIARIAPAYGIGGIGNTYFRDEWREMLIRREIRAIHSVGDGQKMSAWKLIGLVTEKQ